MSAEESEGFFFNSPRSATVTIIVALIVSIALVVVLSFFTQRGESDDAGTGLHDLPGERTEWSMEDQGVASAGLVLVTAALVVLVKANRQYIVDEPRANSHEEIN